MLHKRKGAPPKKCAFTPIIIIPTVPFPREQM